MCLLGPLELISTETALGIVTILLPSSHHIETMYSNLNSHITSYILHSHIIIIIILAKHLLIYNEGYHTYAKLASKNNLECILYFQPTLNLVYLFQRDINNVIDLRVMI